MTPSVLIALFTNTPLPGVLEKRALWGSSLLTQTHTHSQMFPFLIPPYSSIHSYIFAKGRGEERAKKKKQLEPAEATATAQLLVS
jgi:hypothetical protein